MGFSSRLSFGQSGQDYIIKFLESHFGYKFEAGERNGKLVNADLIEELENCEVISPKDFSGARLRFVRENIVCELTMPDMFVSRNSSSGFYWIEAKRHEQDSNEFIIDCDNFDDYVKLYEEFTRHDFYAMCLNPIYGDENHCDLFWCDMSELIRTKPKKEIRRRNNVYVWNMFEVMGKLNKYPIDMRNYE